MCCRTFSFCFSHTRSPHISTPSLHDALPILPFLAGDMPFLIERLAFDPVVGADEAKHLAERAGTVGEQLLAGQDEDARDRKSTRLNSSHGYISYAVFCLKKKHHAVLTPLDLQ